jgi:serine/threonine protein kinase
MIMHKYNVYHSDYKPANIILDEEIYEEVNIMKVKVKIKLIDFGCATLRYNDIPCGYSEKYSPHKFITKFENDENPFIDVNERIKYEKFQIGRLLLFVVLNDIINDKIVND